MLSSILDVRIYTATTITDVCLGDAYWHHHWVSFCCSTRCNKEQEEKIQQLEKEIAVLEEHKAQVSSHFQKTASLLHDMTGQYRTIYEHMAEGAQTLCDDQEGAAVLESLQSGLLLEKKKT